MSFYNYLAKNFLVTNFTVKQIFINNIQYRIYPKFKYEKIAGYHLTKVENIDIKDNNIITKELLIYEGNDEVELKKKLAELEKENKELKNETRETTKRT